MFNLTTTRSRIEILEAAESARIRGRLRKAIARYQKLLKRDPDDHLVHLKLAALLAKTRRFEESWASFETACRGFLDAGFSEKALGIYMQAAKYMPGRLEVWKKISALQLERGLRADALDTLLRGQKYFRGRRRRPEAIELLRIAHKIAPGGHEVTIKLAVLLAKENERNEALRLLHGLAQMEYGRKLRTTRGAILKISPSFKNFYLWLHAALRGR